MWRGTGQAHRGCGPETRIAIKLHDPVDVIRALVALDGQVAAILLLSHALPLETAIAISGSAGCTMLVQDVESDGVEGIASVRLENVLGPDRRPGPLPTAWLMTTSGTTGLPKIVPHTLRSLARSVYRFPGPDKPVWGLLNGLAGFPLSYLEKAPGNVRMSVRDDVLWLCPPLTALRPGLPGIQVDEEGYVCSGDRVAVRDDRILFLGRENGLIRVRTRS